MKIEKVYLLNPPIYNQKDRLVREGRCMQRESSWSNLWMPVTLCTLKPLLKRELNTECKVRDAVADRFSFDDVKKEIEKFNPDMIVVNTAVPSIIAEDLDTAKFIKEHFPNIFVAMIGIPPTSMVKVIYHDQRGKFVDACIMHEPEYPLIGLIKTINKGEDWKQCKGIAYKKDKVIFNQPTQPTDLSWLPTPDYDDLDLDQYTLPFSREKVVIIGTSRGCPGKCTFCIGKVYCTQIMRYRDPIKVVDDIEKYISKYNVKKFLFWADTWMLGKKIAEKTCDEIIKRDLDIGFLCNARVEAAHLDLLMKMKKAGCEVLAFGVESAHQKVLDMMKKGITVEQIGTAIRNANKAGVPNSAHMIVGLPGETWETVKISTERIIKFNPTYVNVYNPVPYPGTELFEIAKKNDWIMTYDWRLYEELHSVMRNADMSTEDIKRAKQYMTRKFYLRPRIVAREIKRAIIDEKSIKRLYYLGIDGLRFMKGWIYGGKKA